MSGSAPSLPTLMPRETDSIWFTVDKPCDDESELAKQELEYNTWLQQIRLKDNTIVPIGKTMEHLDEEDDEDEDDEGDDDDESDTNDDELDTDMMDDRDSGDDASTY